MTDSDSPGVATQVDRGQINGGDSMRLFALGIFFVAIVAAVANAAHSITGGGVTETLAVAAGLCLALGAAFTGLSYASDKRGDSDV